MKLMENFLSLDSFKRNPLAELVAILPVRRLGNASALAALALGFTLSAGYQALAKDVVLEAVPEASPTNAQATVEITSTTSSSFSSSNATGTSQVRITKSYSFKHEGVVLFGQNYTLKSNEVADAVVLFGGNADIQGDVSAAVVVFGGNLKLSGTVEDAVVVFGGNVNLETNATVAGDVVNFGGDVRLAPGSKVAGDLVTLGGKADISPTATVSGDVQQSGFGNLGGHLPTWLTDWVTQCVFKLRPLSCSVPWVWWVAGAFFLLYLLTALALRRPVNACLKHLEETPVTSFLVGLLGKLLFPLILGLFAITGIGLLGVPFLLAALVIAVVIGKVALFECFGRQLGRWFKYEPLQRPLLAFFVGWLLITLLYLVPVLGLVTMVLTAMWGFGAALQAAFASSRREKPPQNPTLLPVAPWPPTAPMMPQPLVAGAPGEAAGSSFVGSVPPLATPDPRPVPPPFPPPFAPAPALAAPEALLFPRAGLLPRVASAFLDTVLVAIVGGISGLMNLGPLSFMMITVAYYTAMWTWKGTTVGGIVCGLKVVRLDGQPVTWVVMLVRSLAAWFGVAVMFLGFLWIAWDPERQGWHDRIAGTVVVKLPRGTPLVCL